jgi:spermidine synthase
METSLSSNTKNLQSALIFLIIVLEGFVTVSIEILTIRQLIPFVGSNVVVTSLIIGIFLFFLAIGYWQGGQLQANFYEKLRRNFYISAWLTVIGLSYAFVALFFLMLDKIFHQNALLILNIYLLLIIAPLIYLLGQTVPITMNLVKQEKLSGMVGGKVLFISTVGSFLGSVLTTLLLMQYLGVAATVFINACILAALVLLLIRSPRGFLISAILIPALVFVGYSWNVKFEKQNFLRTNNYANYQIASAKSVNYSAAGKIFLINNGMSSFLDSKNHAFKYIEVVKSIIFDDLKLHDKDILVIGAGGFSLSAEKTNGNRFTYVDIDPRIKSIAEKNFIPKVQGTFWGEDARVFFNNNHKLYNVVVSDAYSNTASIPPALVTFEYFQQVRSALDDDGIAIFNIIADPFMEDNYSKRIDNTLRSVFGNCTVNAANYSSKRVNIVYVCKKSVKEQDRDIYSDNMNSSMLDSFAKNKR